MAEEILYTQKVFNGSDYDTLYPETVVEQVQGAIADPATKTEGQLLGYNGNVWAAVDTPAGLKGASGVLYVEDWVQQANGSWAQTISIPNVGLTSASNVIVDCALSMIDLDADVEILKGWGYINNAVAGTNQLTFYAYVASDNPVNIPVNVVVSG